MAAEARAIRFQLGLVEASGYQLACEEAQRLLFTHRQIAEVVGKSKGTAQKFCKSKESELPETITAVVPDKPRPVALSSWEAAVALPQGEQLPLNDQLQQLEGGLSLIAKWLEEAGLEQRAITLWKFNVLAQRFPALADAVKEAQEQLAAHSHVEPSGMIASQVAAKVSKQIGRKVTAAQVNAALHELELQQWAKPNSRERRLTEKGKKYGQAMLAISKTNAWSGAQLRWFDSVVPLLCDFFEASHIESHQ
jgi:hypothetical protein